MPRHRNNVILTCEACRKEFSFYACPSNIRRGLARFCSEDCYLQWKTSFATNQVCEYCQKEFRLTACQVRRRETRFCSRDCYKRGIRTPLADLFYRYVGPKVDNGCMLWTGTNSSYGYGDIVTYDKNGKRVHLQAHRVSWELQVGPIPDGMWVLHNCPSGDNPQCVNHEHLFIGTRADNIADAVAKGSLSKGEDRYNAKLTDAIAAEIRERYKAGGISQKKLGEEYDVKQGIIWGVIHMNRWK